MQNFLRGMLKSRSGSVLIGAVVFTLIMTIAGAAVVALSRNTISGEVDAYNDALAFTVAEAGLLMGTSWLKNKSSNYESVKINGSRVLGFMPDIPGDNYAGFRSHVTLKWEDGNAATGAEAGIVVTSCAIEINNGDILPYTKCIDWKLSGTPGNTLNPGTFIDNLGPDVFGGFGNPNNGLHHQASFYGPIHSNTPIQISHGAPKGQGNNNPVRFYGQVTFYDNDYTYNERSGEYSGQRPGVTGFGLSTTGHRNNYMRGVVSPVDQKVADLNSVFQNTFSPGKKLGTAFDNTAAQVIILDQANGTTIEFGTEGGRPYYNPGTTAATRVFYNDGTSPQSPVIIYADFDLTVRCASSGATGNVSVRTGTDKNITFDLSGANSTLKHFLYNGISADAAETIVGSAGAEGLDLGTNQSVFGFYSGGYVNFMGIGNNETYYITGQVFATEKAGTGTFRTVDNSGSPDSKGNSNTHIHVLGSAAMNKWWKSGSNNNDPVLKSYFDKRVGADGKPIGAPGISFEYVGGDSADPEIRLIRSSWKERNETPKLSASES